MWMGTPAALLPVERVGHGDGNRGEAGLISVQPSGIGTGPARAVSKSEYQWSPPSGWETLGAHCRATTEWMPQRAIGAEHGLNPTLLMPIGEKLHSLIQGSMSHFKDAKMVCGVMPCTGYVNTHIWVHLS